MPTELSTVTVVYGTQAKTVEAAPGALVGDVVIASGLPLEQPCAGRGICGKCRVLAEAGLAAPDAVELENLTAGERAVGTRLACRARIAGDTEITLAPVVVYSNKIFRASNRYRSGQAPLGLAIDFGSTTVAAFLTMLDNGEVCAGGAALNQQTAYGADVISRLAAARSSPAHGERLRRLALASIAQAINSLNLAPRILARIQRAVVVCNVGMHHLMLQLPIESLAVLPFQPSDKSSLHDATSQMGGVFPPNTHVRFPPLIGGFVGSDALACLAYFGFDHAPGPLVAIDLGTNGEVLVTDGHRILTASTAAGPAFEGVNISCGTRAVDGAIVNAALAGGEWHFETIANEPPVGLTGSGLLRVVHSLVEAGVVEPNGRITATPPFFADRITRNGHGARCVPLDGERLTLSQWDIRELQKAKGAIRAAIEILMAQLGLVAEDLTRVILTGSFGGQVDVETALGLGLIPPVPRERVFPIANGAGLGAAMFLSDEGFSLGERLAARAEQVNLDQDPNFDHHYVAAMRLAPGAYSIED